MTTNLPQSARIRGPAAALLGLSALLLGACAGYPTGPTVMALPGTGMSFDQFRADDAQCQSYALQATGTSTQAAAEQSAANSAAAGTVLGAAAGALIGSASGDTGEGAAIGAASGLLVGSAAGADSYATTGSRTQARYDSLYVQCMYSSGHRVPVPAGIAAAPDRSVRQGPAPRVAPGYYPPAGMPPPPGY
jgi:hypothetical protein